MFAELNSDNSDHVSLQPRLEQRSVRGVWYEWEGSVRTKGASVRAALLTLVIIHCGAVHTARRCTEWERYGSFVQGDGQWVCYSSQLMC